MKPDQGAVLHTRDLVRKLSELQEENKDLRNKVGKLSKRVLEDKGPDLHTNLSVHTIYTYITAAPWRGGKPPKVAWSVDEDGEVFTFDMPKRSEVIYRLHVPGNKETWGFELEMTPEEVAEMKADGLDITGPFEEEEDV